MACAPETTAVDMVGQLVTNRTKYIRLEGVVKYKSVAHIIRETSANCVKKKVNSDVNSFVEEVRLCANTNNANVCRKNPEYRFIILLRVATMVGLEILINPDCHWSYIDGWIPKLQQQRRTHRTYIQCSISRHVQVVNELSLY